MVWRPKIAIAAISAAFVLFGFVVWRSIPDLPSVEAPRTAGPGEEFTAVEPGEYGSSEREILKRFGEPPLTDDSLSGGTTYRLILLPTFDEPIFVQARVDAAGASIKTKVLNGVGGYGLEKLGVLSINKERPLTRDEWDYLAKMVIDSGFWAAPGIDRTDVMVYDGAAWALYGRDLEVFHRIHRITPEPSSLELFRYLLRLAGNEEEYKAYW